VSCFCLDRAGHVQHPENTKPGTQGASHIRFSGHGFPAQTLHEGCEGFLGKPDPSAIQPIDIVPGFQAGLPGKGWFVVRQAHDDCSP